MCQTCIIAVILVKKRSIRRCQRGTLPKEPKTITEFKLEDERTKTARSQRFLIHDSGSESQSRVVVFASDEALRHLARQDEWFIDGTFSLSPKIFQQLYIIRAKLGTSAVTCVYALLNGKSQSHYEEIMQAVLKRCEELGFTPDPTTVHLDFEQAAINAVKATFGPHVLTLGCLYHLTQATWRKVQELGLSQYYTENGSFRHFCGMLDGLAFLPLSDVTEGMQYLRNLDEEYTDDLLDYFDHTYVSGSFRWIQRPALPGEDQPTIRLRKMPPLFPPQMWNVHNATLRGDARTNNLCETWNNSFSQLVGHKHPSVWRLLTHIKEDESLSRLQICQDSRGEPPRKRVKKATKDLQQRLSYLCSEIKSGNKSLKEFLKGVGHSIRLIKV